MKCMKIGKGVQKRWEWGRRDKRQTEELRIEEEWWKRIDERWGKSCRREENVTK